MPVHSRSSHHPHSIRSHSTTKKCRVNMRRHTWKTNSIVDRRKCRHHARKTRGRETTIDTSAHMATESTSHHTFPSTSTTTTSASDASTHISFSPVLHIVPTLTSALHPLPTSSRAHPAIVPVITHASLVAHSTVPITIVVVSTATPSLMLSLTLCLRLVQISSAHLPQILLGSKDDNAGPAIEEGPQHQPASPEEWIHDAPNSQPVDQEVFQTP
ncbi:unnamed protein product [Victoria cruziana]